MMKKTAKRVVFILLAAGLALGLSNCIDCDDDNDRPALVITAPDLCVCNADCYNRCDSCGACGGGCYDECNRCCD